jgi:hypothetical protein
MECIKKDMNIRWSLRDVRRFLRRANDFVGWNPNDSDLPPEIKSITIADIAVSFILSEHNFDIR